MSIIYLLIMGVLFSGVFFYLINYTLIPYTEDYIVDVKNLTIASICFVLALACLFGFLHAGLDKLFFRKFYEQPRIFLAVRRGILLSAILVGLAWMRIFGYWLWYIALLVILLVILIEALFISFDLQKKSRDEMKKRMKIKEDIKKHD